MSNQESNISLVPKSEKFSTYSYIENEFFNVDRETLRKITDLYYDLYGYGPHKYLLDTYHSWKSGYVSTSGQTLSRIIKCVPRFLSDEKRFIILKNELIYFIENLHNKQQGKNANLSELNSLYENYAMQIENFNQSNLPYMVSKRIFTEEEIEEFLNVCKYILFEKLKFTYNQVQKDLVLIKEKLSNFRNGVFEAVYRIDFLNTKIDLANIYEINFDFINLNQKEIDINGTYQRFAEEYILEERSKINYLEEKGKNNYFIISKDLEVFLNEYHQVGFKENKSVPKSEFRGEAGRLNLTFEVNTLNLKNEVINYIKNLHHKQQNKKALITDLNSLFENYIEHIEKFNSNNLSFITKTKFTPEKIEQFTRVCKFALLEKLNFAYRQVQNDLNLIKNKLSSLNTGTFNASYQIDFLNSQIDICSINEINLNFITLKQKEINLNENYKKFAEQYILEEFMQMSFSEKEGAVNHFIKSKDLEFFLNQYDEINRKDNEATLKSEFKGEGGQLNLILEIKSVNKMKSLIFLSGVKMTIYLAILIIATLLIIKFEVYKFILIPIIGGIVLCNFLFSNFKTEIKTIKTLKHDIKRYGK
jgi:hypothetical protein